MKFVSRVTAAGLMVFMMTASSQAANQWFVGRSVGLSLGDRACLGLARILGLPAITAGLASLHFGTPTADASQAVPPLILFTPSASLMVALGARQS